MNILISSSMKVYAQLAVVKERLEALGYVVELPEPGTRESSESEVDYKRRMIDMHLEKLQRADVLLIGNIGGRIGASTFFEAGWAFALHKPIYVLEEIDDSSDYAEDLRAIGAIELKGDLSRIGEYDGKR